MSYICQDELNMIQGKEKETMSQLAFKKVVLPYTDPGYIPETLTVKLPEDSNLAQQDRHFLIYIPWEEKYLELVPEDFREFFAEVRSQLDARTTDVHTAVCLSFLDEFIQKMAERTGKQANRKVVGYALALHDAGWSQMSEEEIAVSLGVTGLALTLEAVGPKERHAQLGEQFARRFLTEKQEELGLSDTEIDLICLAILHHDKPEYVAGMGKEIPVEVQMLVDLDHLWSFTQLNFWQDTLRKGVSPEEYLQNLEQDLPNYFVTEVGKEKAKELLEHRRQEVTQLSAEVQRN